MLHSYFLFLSGWKTVYLMQRFIAFTLGRSLIVGTYFSVFLLGAADFSVFTDYQIIVTKKYIHIPLSPLLISQKNHSKGLKYRSPFVYTVISYPT